MCSPIELAVSYVLFAMGTGVLALVAALVIVAFTSCK